MAYLEKFAQSGFYLRLSREQYEKYVGKLPAAYAPLKFAYLFLDAEEEIPNHVYTWSPLASGGISGGVDVTKEVPIEVKMEGLIYQYFRGCRTMCRQYTSSPSGTKAMSPDVKSWDPKTAPDIGWLDEEKSPFEYPSVLSEIWILKDVKIEMLAYNPTPIPLTPQTNFIGKKFKYSLVTDRDLLDKLEKRIIPSKPITLEKKIS
ncbi:MAG: hypothetical protein QMD10_11425 [Desulfitobacteriaceae bacterium]|nr:hypothetical protein [Desulfitobacteriaceae bacterium]